MNQDMTSRLSWLLFVLEGSVRKNKCYMFKIGKAKNVGMD